jgi:hypothetical protein
MTIFRQTIVRDRTVYSHQPIETGRCMGLPYHHAQDQTERGC